MIRTVLNWRHKSFWSSIWRHFFRVEGSIPKRHQCRPCPPSLTSAPPATKNSTRMSPIAIIVAIAFAGPIVGFRNLYHHRSGHCHPQHSWGHLHFGLLLPCLWETNRSLPTLQLHSSAHHHRFFPGLGRDWNHSRATSRVHCRSHSRIDDIHHSGWTDSKFLCRWKSSDHLFLHDWSNPGHAPATCLICLALPLSPPSPVLVSKMIYSGATCERRLQNFDTFGRPKGLARSIQPCRCLDKRLKKLY